MSHVNVIVDEKWSKTIATERPIHLVGRTAAPSSATSCISLPPILTPPVEIIARIIELGAEDDQRETFPILASHICGRFRDIALSTPLLWNSIQFQGGRKSYEEIVARLDRSRSVPLDVVAGKLEQKEDAEALINLVLPSVRRWRSFKLDVWEPAPSELVASALNEEAPLLESLTLTGYTSAAFTPFGGNAPSLKHLHVKGMRIHWDSPMFSSLESLYIHSPSFSATSLLGSWQKLKTLTIRSEPLQPLVFHFSEQHVVMPELECLELNGITEEDIVRLLAHVEMPALDRVLFTHIKDSPNQVVESIFPLNAVKTLRLHATEMCQDNLLAVLRKVRNLQTISFEDSSPIPSFIRELTLGDEPDSWVIPRVTSFKVIAFERDNAHRVYDDTDIAEALKRMMIQRHSVKDMLVKMCIFDGDRDETSRHASPWGVERPYKSVRHISLQASQ